jgi:hypothetical protein
MSTLNSSSSLEEIEDAYDDNASYSEDGSVAKCLAFVTACRLLLRRMPKRQGNREGDLELSPELIQKDMDRAQEWAQANADGNAAGSSAAPRVVVGSFRRFRGNN